MTTTTGDIGAALCQPRAASDGEGGFFAAMGTPSSHLCHVYADGASACVRVQALAALAGDRGRLEAVTTTLHVGVSRTEVISVGPDLRTMPRAARIPASALAPFTSASLCAQDARTFDVGGGVVWSLMPGSVIAVADGAATTFISRGVARERLASSLALIADAAEFTLSLGSLSFGGGALARTVNHRPFARSTVEAAVGSLAAIPATRLLMECNLRTHHFGPVGTGVSLVCEILAIPAAGGLSALGTSLTNEVAFGGAMRPWAGFAGAFAGGTVAASVVTVLFGSDERFEWLRLGLNSGLIGVGAVIGHALAGGPTRR